MNTWPGIESELDDEIDAIVAKCKTLEEGDVLRNISHLRVERQNHRTRVAICEKLGFLPPLTEREIKVLEWTHTSLQNDFEKGETEDTWPESIRRRIPDIPFCRPGPEGDPDEFYKNNFISSFYYADSIVQRIRFKGDTQPHFVVRLMGNEDE